jgi:DNA-binding NtrC family response regulator
MVHNARILVVDDDEVIRDTLALLLEQEGYVVDKAENGKEAVAKSYSNFYNLAIIDWRLPDIEGTKLLGELKPTVPKMAKIMLTGFPSMNNAVDAVNNRADAFFLKPMDFEALLRKIKDLLKEQEEARRYSEEKITQFIETKAREIMQTQNIKQPH